MWTISKGKRSPRMRSMSITTEERTGFKSVKSLIKAIRSCKTAAEERALIDGECARIRDALQSSSHKPMGKKRTRALSKLICIYLQTLTFQTAPPLAFGQLDALRLMASVDNFGEKRLGYLAVSLLLDHHQETLVLITNAIKSDLGTATASSTMYATGLALTTLATLATRTMSQELGFEIQRFLSIPNSYLRKKAALALLHCIRMDSTLDLSIILEAVYSSSLLMERHHGVSLTCCALVSELAQRTKATCPSLFAEMQKRISPHLIRSLTSLLFSGGSLPEYDDVMNGTADPFLQASLLRAIRALSLITPDLIEVLTQILSFTSNSSAALAVRYECIETVLCLANENIFADQKHVKIPNDSCEREESSPEDRNGHSLKEETKALCERAIEVLCASFLRNTETSSSANARYVALNIISKSNRLQLLKHSSLIYEAIEATLNDADITIVAKAIDVLFQLFGTERRSIILVLDVLKRERLRDIHSIAKLPSRLLSAIEHCEDVNDTREVIDWILELYQAAGDSVPEQIFGVAARILSTQCSQQLQMYAVHKAAELLMREKSLLAAYVVGEYGHLLADGPFFYEGLLVDQTPSTPLQLVQVLKEYHHYDANDDIITMALAKLAARCTVSTTLFENMGFPCSLIPLLTHEEQLEEVFDVIPQRELTPIHKQPTSRYTASSPSSIQRILADLCFEPLASSSRGLSSDSSASLATPASPKSFMSSSSGPFHNHLAASSSSSLNEQHQVELLKAAGEWLILEREGLLVYLTQFASASGTACRLSIETASTSTSIYQAISVEGINVILEQPSGYQISGNERIIQVVRFEKPFVELRCRLRIRFTVLKNEEMNEGYACEELVDFVSPIAT